MSSFSPPPLPHHDLLSLLLTKPLPPLPPPLNPSLPSITQHLLAFPTSPQPASVPAPSRTMSDPITPVKRASSLMISRGFSFRRSKLVANDVDFHPRNSTHSFSSWGRRSREGGHTRADDTHNTRPHTLSFHVNVSHDTLHHQPLSSSTSPTNLPLQNKRPKFTIEPLQVDTSRSLPSAYHNLPSPVPHLDVDAKLLPRIPQFKYSKSSGPQLPKRRWTLAMAITDEAITDEVLVEELDRLRLKQEISDPHQGLVWGLDKEWDVWEPDRGANSELAPIPPGKDSEGLSRIPYTPSLPSFPTCSSLPTSKPATRSATTPSATWHAARRALLTCRELVRTERHYLASLQSLLASETATVPPALMLRYVDELTSVSQTLLQQIQEDPSAWGVAAAFLAVEHTLESAFVGWCGVVGTWFEGQESPQKRKGSKTTFNGLGGDQVGDTVTRSPLKRSVTWRISVPSMPSLNSIAITPMTSQKAKNRSPTSPSLTASEGSSIRKRRPSVRDLAILPTQRIMRYVLLYRELLDYTPSTSPSRALVGRAMDAACRIAQKCDRAQGNAAFLQKR